MKVEINGYIFEGTPEEIKEYVNQDQEYKNEMIIRYNKCPYCKGNLSKIEISEPLYDFQGQQYIVHRLKCNQCKQVWAYNIYL